MLTLGGVMYIEEMAQTINEIDFEQNLSFIRTGNDSYLIERTNLTLREMRFIDTMLPLEGDEDLDEIPVAERDIRNYADLYRWYPRFTEAEL